MCEDISADYAKCFDQLVKKELNCNVEWLTPGLNRKNIIKDKHLLLVDIQTRIPEDCQHTLNELKITGKYNLYILILKNGTSFQGG